MLSYVVIAVLCQHQTTQQTKMTMKNKTLVTQPFSGTTDQLLNHLDNNFDVDEAEAIANGTSDLILDDDSAINMIKSEMDVDEETAKDILEDIKLEEIKRVMERLVSDGLVEVVSNSNIENPKYRLTENGKLLVKNITQ
jgi:hypothetical protein